MPVFHVTMRAVQPPGPPRKRPSRARQRLFAVLRYFQGVSVVGGLFALTIVLLHSQVLFILLPVGLSVVLTAVTQRTELRNVRALILKTFVALVYFGAITGWELLTHGPGTPEIVGTRFRDDEHTVKAGINYRFNWGGPVVAKY